MNSKGTADPGNNSQLARVWADAKPMRTFLDERTKRAFEETNPALTGPPLKLSATEMMTRNLQRQMQFSDTQKEMQGHTTNDLIAGRLVGIGRGPDAHSFERIDESFWIGASVDWFGNAVSRAGIRLVDVRIVLANVFAPIQLIKQNGPGRPSKGAVIREAIAQHAKGDPRLGSPRFQRYRSYRSYISSQGYDPHRDSGFTDKTFEKYESEFRKNII